MERKKEKERKRGDEREGGGVAHIEPSTTHKNCLNIFTFKCDYINYLWQIMMLILCICV